MRWGAGARPPASRPAPLYLRRFAYALAAAAASLPVSSPLSTELASPATPPSSWAASSGGALLVRKERDAPAEGAPSGALTTLATLVNLHTGELLPLSETEPTPEQFSELLEDRGLQSRVEMSPDLLDMLRAVARPRALSQGVRIEIVSGYRSPKRNEMMRKKGRNVASHSQHTLGMAIDFRVQGLRVGDLVKELEALRWAGGIGRYDGRGDLFVHVDMGPRRRWRGR